MFLRRNTAYFLYFINAYLKEVEPLLFALTSNLLSFYNNLTLYQYAIY